MTNFVDQIAALGRGRFFDELEENVTDVLEGVMATRKKGSVTITISMGMEGNEADQLNMQAKFAKKRPTFDPASTTMFVDKGMSLTTKDPKQRDFGDIEEVSTEFGDVYDPKTGEVAG